MGKGIPTFGSQVFSCLIYLTMLRSSHPLWNHSGSSPYVNFMTEPGNKSREGRWTQHTFLSWHLPFGYWNKSTCMIPLVHTIMTCFALTVCSSNAKEFLHDSTPLLMWLKFCWSETPALLVSFSFLFVQHNYNHNYKLPKLPLQCHQTFNGTFSPCWRNRTVKYLELNKLGYLHFPHARHPRTKRGLTLLNVLYLYRKLEWHHQWHHLAIPSTGGWSVNFG